MSIQCSSNVHPMFYLMSIQCPSNAHPMFILIIPDAETWARLTNQARGSSVHEYFRWAHHAFKYTSSTQWRNKTPLRLYQNPSHFPPIAKILRRSRTSASTGWLGGSLLTSRAGDATSPWTSWRWLWASSSPSFCLSLCQFSLGDCYHRWCHRLEATRCLSASGPISRGSRWTLTLYSSK